MSNMSNMSGTIGIIYTIITICIIIMVALIGIVFYIWWQNKKRLEGKDVSTKSLTKNDASSTKLQGVASMKQFLAFDEVVDNMIVRKKGEQYVMVIQAKGINYDLLGEDEKIAVENGFVQFLNVLRFPVQLYVQTRRLNLNENIRQYVERINKINDDIAKLDMQIKKETSNGRMELVRKLEFDKRRKINILEYGMDVTNYVSRLSQNKDVLQQNTYVVLSYYKSEFGGEIQNYSREEIDNIAFSELYTRAQTLIRGLAAAGVGGRVLNSEELAELLYIAYNRDDSELINIRRCVDAEYDSLYNTAKDVLEKQKELLEDNIDEEAVNLTAASIKKADKIRKIRREHKDEIKRKALDYVEQYKYEMTDELYDETRKQIQNAKLDETDEKKELDEKKKTKDENKTSSSEMVTVVSKDGKTKKVYTREEYEARKRALAKRKAAQLAAQKKKAQEA